MASPETEVVSHLKRDAFGRVDLVRRKGRLLVRRVTCGGSIPGSPLVARWLARRERRALERLEGIEGVPTLEGPYGREFIRSYLPGRRLERGMRPPDSFFDRLEEILRRIHERGVAHNDIEKCANVLLLESGSPAVLDFQLAVLSRPRGWLRLGGLVLRTMQSEDRRHVAKLKARFRPDLLTGEDRRRIAEKSQFARGWATFVKPVYHFVTRGLLRTADREGRGPARRGSPRG
jgi:hypothetical protein